MPAEQACGEVILRVRYAGGELQIVNEGNIPIRGLDIKKRTGATIDAEHWVEPEGLGIGRSIGIDVVSGYEEIVVYPVILGETTTGRGSYTCKNHGFIAE